MAVELKGVIEFYEAGHKIVDLVVKVDEDVRAKMVRMGVDIKLNEGKIRAFLAVMYGIPPGAIVWPSHIRVKEEES